MAAEKSPDKSPEKEIMVKCEVRVSQLAIDVIPGNPVIYRKGAVFDCPEGRAKRLGNSVKII